MRYGTMIRFNGNTVMRIGQYDDGRHEVMYCNGAAKCTRKNVENMQREKDPARLAWYNEELCKLICELKNIKSKYMKFVCALNDMQTA